jgi:hypothetical protein
VKAVPPELIKAMTVEVQVNGKWKEVATVENNLTRLIKTQFGKVRCTAVRITLKETYGHPTAKLFEIRAYES